MGKLDTLINCAGLSIPFKRPNNDVDNREWLPKDILEAHILAEVSHDLLSQVDESVVRAETEQEVLTSSADWADTHRANVNGRFRHSPCAIA